MKAILQKLKNKSGASMLLTLAFLMICLFVGGSVLAAATANGSRVANITKNEQAYLSQRSAMFLLSDMIKDEPDENLQLIIKDVIVEQLDATPHATPTRTVTFLLPDVSAMTQMQKLLYENAVDLFIDNCIAGYSNYNTTIYFENFVFENNTVTYDSSFNLPDNSGNITVDAALGGERNEDLTAVYTVDEDFNLQIVFSDNALVSLDVDTVSSPDLDTYMPEEGSVISDGVVIESGGVRTTTRTSIIQWEDPLIRKKGD